MTVTPQMDVLYMQGAGHVLGIFTRASELTQIETDVSGFVGSDGLSLRGLLVPGKNVVIPQSLIGIFRADRNWRQIFEPSTLYMTGLPNSPALMPIPNLTPFPGTTFATPNLKVTLAANATLPVSIVVLALGISGGVPGAFPAQIPSGQKVLTIPMVGLTSGNNYNAFVFVPTFQLAVLPFTAP